MSTALTILKKLESIDVLEAARISITNTHQYAEAQQKLQLFQGIGADDLEIIPSYSQKTIAIKRRKNQPVDRVTLRDTGAFYAGIRIDVVGEVIRTDSIDDKSQDLQGRYGGEIFGAGTNYRTRYKKILLPEFIKQIKAKLK